MSAPAPDDDATDLPGLPTWPAVYLVVTIAFVIYVGLLTALTRMFS
jgi:hypothetical protein